MASWKGRWPAAKAATAAVSVITAAKGKRRSTDPFDFERERWRQIEEASRRRNTWLGLRAMNWLRR